MVNKMEKLIASREVVKGQLARFSEFISEAVPNSEVEIESRLDQIQPLLDRFNNIQSEIEFADDTNEEANERKPFESQYFKALAAAKTILKGIAKAPVPNPNPETINSNFSALSGARLPNIALPKFKGDYKMWTQYIEMFETLVDKNPQLDVIQKFYHLVGSLDGDAKRVIDCLEMTRQNYPTALDMLKRRFDNKQVIIQSHLKAIVDMPAVTKECSILLRSLSENLDKHLRALNNLGEPTDKWDRIVILIMSRKLDSQSHHEWERETMSRFAGNPKIKDFTEFLTRKCDILDTVSTNLTFQKSTFSKRPTHQANIAVGGVKCNFCKGTHPTNFCRKLLNFSVQNRITEVKKARLCINCLKPGHFLQDCTATKCRKCSRSHNTILHLETTSDPRTQTQDTGAEQAIVATSVSTRSVSSQSLLGTAIALVKNSSGNFVEARLLIDNGSQINFITSDLVKALGIRTKKYSFMIGGINQISTKTNHQCRTTLKSRYNNYSVEVDFVILDNITAHLPTQSFDASALQIPSHFKLADPTFNVSNRIDILIGVNYFYEVLCAGQFKIGKNLPVMQKTLFGWIISGSMGNRFDANQTKVCNLSIESDIKTQLAKFWEIEECRTSNKLRTLEESECEDNFTKTTIREPTGRFCVTIPLRSNVDQLGSSFEMALERFKSVEKRLNKNIHLREQYTDFMEEYLNLGHMTALSTEMIRNPPNGKVFYLPHHCVINDSSLTTKVRVVFDGSAPSSSGLSLNQVQMVGPKVQDDLFDILIRFRHHKVVIIADVAKMYRQVNISPKQRDLQRILWRRSPDSEIEHFQLNTVTYGTASSSFLSTRCLKQIANDINSRDPELSRIIANDFYVDDLITGANSVKDAIIIGKEISLQLEKYCFPLRKWSSNHIEVLNGLSNDHQATDSYFITEGDVKKTLGIFWKSKSDILEYVVNDNPIPKGITKRTILSISSQIFDPLGLVGPVTISSKILLQKLWSLGLNWDEAVPITLRSTWLEIYSQLKTLNEIKIPRRCILSHHRRLELHGFCDASEAAYGACVYILSSNLKETKAQLLCAKSKVAPLKVISLPRLELCGALLLSNLIARVIKSLDIKFDTVHLWTDSTIVLSWLAGQPANWKAFVGNRVAEIQELTANHQWHHVSSKDNPADIISRGATPHQLKQSTLWFYGPTWLALSQSDWPTTCDIDNSNIPDKRQTKLSHTSYLIDESVFLRYSTLYELQRTTSLLLRFHNKLKSKAARRNFNLSPHDEMMEALLRLIKLAQSSVYAKEIHMLENNKDVPIQSDIRSLDPFLGHDGLIRVGGRLKNAELDFNAKHPIILPPKHPLTKLIILDAHLKNMHAGPQAILNTLRQNYWPVNAKRTIRGVLNKCFICFRVKPTTLTQKMGDLPKERVMPIRPFHTSGVDFAGPFNIKDGKLRNRAIIKAYMCLFVCFTTKAVHIELVSDLTTMSFLNCLKRFIARRGNCKFLYSDNATNFHGANNELNKFYKKVLIDQDDPEIIKFYLTNSIQWKMIPPGSPHQGGLWEAGIKSAKYHTKRIVGTSNLTFEQLTTIFAQIEAILNSRPLTPISNNPGDLTALTPGHFLIGESLTSIPHIDFTNTASNRLNQYQLLEQFYQQLWKRWSHEYLHTLQQRKKWQATKQNPLRIGTMVVLKEDNLPPLLWKLGRIEALHPGPDGLIRVVSVRTSNATTKRAINKICILPMEGENENPILPMEGANENPSV